MKEENQIGKITDSLFLVGLVTLIVNDFFLKYVFHNELTGKLSDIAGLFIFPYFFSALKPRYTKFIYCSTGVIFIFWKLPVSQAFVDLANSIGIQIYRTIDYLDLLTLFILPFSYRYFNSKNYANLKLPKPVTVPLVLLSVFSFCATTLPRQQIDIKINTDKAFILDIGKENLLSRLTPAHGYSDTLQKNLADSLFYVYLPIPNMRAEVVGLVNINKLGSDKVNIGLDSIISSYVTGSLFSGISQKDIDRINKLRAEDYENYFNLYFVEQIKNNTKGVNLYYDNKAIHDSYRRQE